MKRITAILAVLAVATGLLSCTSYPPVPPGPAHDCCNYWGGAADELLPLLTAMNGPGGRGPGWARGILDDSEYQSLLNLKTALEDAVDAPTVAPRPRTPDKTCPSVAAMAALADTMRRGVQPPMPGQPTGLEGDHGTACHSPVPRGWLPLPDGSNGLAVNKAWLVLHALHDALDM